MARVPYSYSLFGFMLLMVVLSASQLSMADYVYCAKQGDSFCPGKECESINFAPDLPPWNCPSCAYRCHSAYLDAFRGSFCYPNAVLNSNCLCCFHSLADEEIYMPPAMSPMGTPIPAPVQLAPQTPPPVFTVNQDPAVYCYDGYPVTSPVGDCSECNERCRLGSFQQYGLPGAFFQYGLAGVFCYITRQGKPFCNCCVYGDMSFVVPDPVITAPPMPPQIVPPTVPPVVTPTPPTDAPQTPACADPVTPRLPPVMSPDVEPAAAPHTSRKSKKEKDPKVEPAAAPHTPRKF